MENRIQWKLSFVTVLLLHISHHIQWNGLRGKSHSVENLPILACLFCVWHFIKTIAFSGKRRRLSDKESKGFSEWNLPGHEGQQKSAARFCSIFCRFWPFRWFLWSCTVVLTRPYEEGVWRRALAAVKCPENPRKKRECFWGSVFDPTNSAGEFSVFFLLISLPSKSCCYFLSF